MTREIKFRCWSKIQRKMIYPNHYPFSIDSLNLKYYGSSMFATVKFERPVEVLIKTDGYNGNNPTLNGYWNGNKYYHIESYEEFKQEELMQYTGLKDKEDNEIYEGDIVETDKFSGTIGKFDNVIGKVVFHNCKFVVQYSFDLFMSCELHGNTTIIGNIYENPELIIGDLIE